MKEQTIHCVTCCQALPDGQDHPRFFAQSSLTPDPTDVFNLHEELSFLLSDIETLLNVLYDREADHPEQRRDTDVLGVYGLLQNLTAEAHRRASRLKNAGMYWQGEIDQRHDGSLFPDLPPPHGGADEDQQRKEGGGMDEKQIAREAHVRFETLVDGTVHVHIYGENGQSLDLVVDVRSKEPMAAIPRPWTARRGLYRAVVGVQANGHLKGYLVDQQNDQLLWFPARAKPKRKRTKRQATTEQEG